MLLFDYSLQVWVQDGKILRCGHPETMRQFGPCCRAFEYQGQVHADVRAARSAQVAGLDDHRISTRRS
jgi:hypothetical protein